MYNINDTIRVYIEDSEDYIFRLFGMEGIVYLKCYLGVVEVDNYCYQRLN